MITGAPALTRAAATLCVAAVFTYGAGAQDGSAPSLAMPVDCVLGETCHIQNHVDRDPGPGHADHACGRLTYDGHQGTDIALRDLAAMRAGVDVLAAAPGTVRAVRDLWPDVSIRDPEAPDLGGQDCGNGVVVDHGGGWSTQSCHLMRGSVAVRAGDRVATGDVLGRIGLSGRTEFPHLHLTLRRGEAVVDPFDADGTPGCDDGRSLWRAAPDYVPTGIVAAGLLDRLPAYEEVRDAAPPTAGWPAREGDAVVGWLHAFGGRAGDVVRLSIDGPAGPVHRQEEILDRDQASMFRAAGRSAPEGGWPPGTYEARFEIVRDGRPVLEAVRTARLTAR